MLRPCKLLENGLGFTHHAELKYLIAHFETSEQLMFTESVPYVHLALPSPSSNQPPELFGGGVTVHACVTL